MTKLSSMYHFVNIEKPQAFKTIIKLSHYHDKVLFPGVITPVLNWLKNGSLAAF